MKNEWNIFKIIYIRSILSSLLFNDSSKICSSSTHHGNSSECLQLITSTATDWLWCPDPPSANSVQSKIIRIWIKQTTTQIRLCQKWILRRSRSEIRRTHVLTFRHHFQLKKQKIRFLTLGYAIKKSTFGESNFWHSNKMSSKKSNLGTNEKWPRTFQRVLS